MNDSAYDENIIEGLLLDALNEIMYPEAEFERIRIQQTKMSGEYVWEIYLKEWNGFPYPSPGAESKQLF